MTGTANRLSSKHVHTKSPPIRRGLLFGVPVTALRAMPGAVSVIVVMTGRLGGAGPLRTLMTGTASRTARVSIARSNPKEAAGKIGHQAMGMYPLMIAFNAIVQQKKKARAVGIIQKVCCRRCRAT